MYYDIPRYRMIILQLVSATMDERMNLELIFLSKTEGRRNRVSGYYNL